jgi:hypothetical protein
MFIDEYCEDLEVILAYINSPSLGMVVIPIQCFPRLQLNLLDSRSE